MRRGGISTRNWCTMVIVLIVGLMSAQTIAANTKQTIEQVTANVTIADDVDYVITSATPFTDGAVVDIENTEHAVVILQAVKPSAALKLLDHLTIRGEKAANNKNCQVKLYNRGTIILPYASTLRPLIVFSEKNFKGDTADDFGLGKFLFQAVPGENVKNYVYLLFDHIYSAICFSFKVDTESKYDKLRTIRLKKLRLLSSSMSKYVDATITLYANNEGVNPLRTSSVTFSDNGTATVSGGTA